VFNIVVWVADVGSIAKDRFYWCRAPSRKEETWSKPEKDINQFAEGIAKDLRESKKVALGFECPLFVPVRHEPRELTKGRKGWDGHGDGDRPWSAGAGCAALATGLTECVWLFERIREKFSESAQKYIRPTFDWTQFISNDANLFIWEAFVSKNAKGASHSDDARIAARTFWAEYPNIVEASAVNEPYVYSLVGAALLRSMLTKKISMLRKPCIVIKS